MIVGVIFAILVCSIIWAIIRGRKIIRTEKTDAVFGNPVRALGGWHWVIAGVATILSLWFYFSWDAGRAFFPKSANELCQVAKLTRAANPVRSRFPLDNRLLQGTQLLQRDYVQINSLENRLSNIEFSDASRNEIKSVIAEMRDTMAAAADPELFTDDMTAQFESLAADINALTEKLDADDYPGPRDDSRHEKALAQPGWGQSTVEIPTLPLTERGRKFDAASVEMEAIADNFVNLKNESPALLDRLAALKERIDALKPESDDDEKLVARRKDLIKQIGKIYKRIDDGRIFPPGVTAPVEAALTKLDRVQKEQQGSLRLIDRIALPGGAILAGNDACTEQGSGRWLPKPSDTLRTFLRMAHPNEGYKGFPLLWYKMKPVSEMAAFIIPDWVADLIPGEYPRHDAKGEITENLKSRVYNFAIGNYDSPSIPVPTGHIWDSIVRVLSGLFLGVVLGVPLGLFMGLSRFAKGYFDPLIELYRPVPPLAWAPLILTIFGIQDDGKIFLLFMVAFAIMVISARTGATGTQLSKIHAAHSLGATNRQILRRVILPNSLPEILTGIRISIGVCWGTLVAAEMLAGTTGIGFVENVARKQSDYEIIWMTIILLGLLGLLFDLVMRWIINRSIPWRGKG